MSALSLSNYLITYSRAYSFAEDIYKLTSNDKLKDLLMAPKLEIIREMTKDLQELYEASQKYSPEFRFPNPVKVMAEEIRQNIDNYPKVIINQTLSILCSLFETFLIESLEAILDTKPETIIQLSEQQEIKLARVIEIGDYQKILGSFKDKILKEFSRASTIVQFGKFKKLSCSVDTFFDFSNRPPEIQATYKGWDLNKLSSIFNERHKIIHNGEKPLPNLADLHIRKVFFDHITVNISRELANNFKLAFDLAFVTKS